MRDVGLCLLLLSALSAAAEPASPSASPPASPSSALTEPMILGAWRFAERDVTVSLYRSADGLVQGKVTASPRPAEVGRWIIRDARWSDRERHHVGRLVTEETGAADAIIDVVTDADGAVTLRLVCSRFFLTKTLLWMRAPTKKEAP